MLHYDKVTLQDLPQMAELFRKYLNDGARVEEYLEAGFHMPGYIGMTCKDGDKLVGVITARPGVEFTIPKPEINKMIDERYPNKKIYTGEMVAVEPEYRGLGISKNLHIQWADEMRAAGGEYVLLELWLKHDGDVPAGGTVKYVGTMEECWTFPDFYKGLEAYGMTCADCAPNPCTCGAVVIVVRL